MGLVLSITNMKGGVGKTTLTANLGHCLSLIHGKKVLLIDVDPQFNLTQYCMDEKTYEGILTDEVNKGTIFNIFIPNPVNIPRSLGGKKTSSDKKKYIYKIRDNLDLIPSSIDLIDFIDQRKSGSERLLLKYIEQIKNDYDIILIDCPPTSTILSRASYLASDAYLIPMGMDYFSVMGIPLLQKDIYNFTDTYGNTMIGLGIIKTKYLDWTAVARKHKRVVDRFSKALSIPVFTSAFRQRQEVQNALSDRKFILEYGPNSDSSKDIKDIATEFISKAGL